MRLLKTLVPSVVLLLVLSAAAADRSETFCPVDRDRAVPQAHEWRDNRGVMQTRLDRPPYWEGTLRVYVVELVSSMGWEIDGQPYDFPFLAYAINSDMLTMNDLTWDTTVTWEGREYGYDSLQEDNIAVQAVLFSPVDGFPEAAAMAYPGVPGSNVVEPGYTHTVFVEEGSATW
jgi:hypothetical protein